MRLRLERFSTPVSPMLLITDDDGNVRGFEFASSEPRTLRLLQIHYGSHELIERPAPAKITKALKAYFKGDLQAVDDIPTATGGTPFQRQVWQALRKIPAATTLSYGQLAAKIGRPTASRAVGMANHRNPIAIIVPCHRVIGASGDLTGYAGGLHNKKWLLAHERQFAPQFVS